MNHEKKICGWNAPVKATSLSEAKELYVKAERPIVDPKKKPKTAKSAKKAKSKSSRGKKPAEKKPVKTAKKPVSKKKAK